MLDALHRLPLADPLSDSLGRLNGQYAALTYVDRAYNVRMPLVAALFATEPIPRGSVVGVRVAAVGIWAAQRSIRGWGGIGDVARTAFEMAAAEVTIGLHVTNHSFDG